STEAVSLAAPAATAPVAAAPEPAAAALVAVVAPSRAVPTPKADRMRYVDLRNAGLPVGSGVTEGAAKTVIGRLAPNQAIPPRASRGGVSLDLKGRSPSDRIGSGSRVGLWLGIGDPWSCGRSVRARSALAEAHSADLGATQRREGGTGSAAPGARRAGG